MFGIGIYTGIVFKALRVDERYGKGAIILWACLCIGVYMATRQTTSKFLYLVSDIHSVPTRSNTNIDVFMCPTRAKKYISCTFYKTAQWPGIDFMPNLNAYKIYLVLRDILGPL